MLLAPRAQAKLLAREGVMYGVSLPLMHWMTQISATVMQHQLNEQLTPGAEAISSAFAHPAAFAEASEPCSGRQCLTEH